MCRHPTDKAKLTRHRDLEAIISQQPMHACTNAGGEGGGSAGAGPPAAKRAKITACEWSGNIGDLAVHLGECAWAPVKCAYEGCTESPLRRDLLEHEATCAIREVRCGGCEKVLECRSLAQHEDRCPWVEIKCPNEGCREMEMRGWMHRHRAECRHEEIPCPGSRGSHSYKCDARFLRKDINAHIKAEHLWEDQPAEVQPLPLA